MGYSFKMYKWVLLLFNIRIMVGPLRQDILLDCIRYSEMNKNIEGMLYKTNTYLEFWYTDQKCEYRMNKIKFLYGIK
jgi:hypothetical protein